MMHSSHRVTSLKQLRQLIQPPSAMLAKRIQSHLDHLCLEFISQATLMVATRNPQGLTSINFATSVYPLRLDDTGAEVLLSASADTLVFALPCHDDGWGVGASDRREGQASLYFMVAGVGHGLRVNGRYQIRPEPGRQLMTIRVKSAYLHCARAATRGDLWGSIPPGHSSSPQPDLAALLAECRYCLLHTSDNGGQSQLSPRGDPAGFIQRLDDGHLFLAERPGNRVAVSLTNILEQPAVAMVGLLPGRPGWLELAGTACISDDPHLLTPCTVAGKRPHLGIMLALDYWAWRPAEALASPALWTPPGDDPAKTRVTPFARALAEHMQGTGLMGKVVHKVVDTVVKRDMKRLY